MASNWFERKSHTVLLAILGVAAYILLMFGNGLVSLTHPDEVFYIQSAKEMLKYNSWLTPMIFDEVQFEKPFLSFSLFMAAIKVFGLTPFAGRFFPSLFGILGVGVVYWISWTLFKNKRLSFLSGMILMSSFIYFALSRAVLTDVIFTVFVTAAIGFFAMAYYNRKHKSLGIMLFFVMTAIAVLTKGLLGITFTFTAALIFLAYKKDIAFLKTTATLWGFLTFLFIAVPWHLIMYNRYGQMFLEEYFYNVHWRRILAAEHKKLDNWYFYIALMFVGVLPWFLYWIPAVRTIWVQFKKKLADRDKFFFLLGWIFSIYIFVQPAHSKLASYIFPAFPAIVIILAYSINDYLEKSQDGENVRLLKVSAWILSFFIVGVSIGGVIAGNIYIELLKEISPIYFGASVLASVALLIMYFNFKAQYTQMVLCSALVTLTLLGTVFYVRPYIEPWVSCKDISDIFLQIERSNARVLSSKFYARGVRYYTDRSMAVIDNRGKGYWSPHPIPHLNSDGKLIDYIKAEDVSWAVIKEGDIVEIKRVIREQKLPYTITQLEAIGGKYIMKIERKKFI